MKVHLIKAMVFPMKVHLVKVMVFPVAIYWYKSWTIKKKRSWTIKKAECQRINAFELWCWRTLESSWDSMQIKPVNPKGNQAWIFIGRTDAKAEAQYFGHLMRRADSKRPWPWERLKAAGEGNNRRWDGWMASWLNGHEFEKLWERGQGSLACYSPWGPKESDMTEQLNSWTTTTKEIRMGVDRGSGKMGRILWLS